ncbi:MAG TPA: O-antigen polymerase [Terracidiphilus sp.]
MSDLPFNPNANSGAMWPSLSVAGKWPHAGGIRTSHAMAEGVFRPRRELPIYCNPIALFVAVWILMLVCLSFHVSYVIYPQFGTPILICVVSIGSLLLGYFASSAILDPDTSNNAAVAYGLDVTRLWHLNLLFCALASALIGFNWFTSGPPPLIGDPASYLIYGKLKQILFPLLACIAVNATLDPSRLRRAFFVTFGFVWLALYVTRGMMLATFLQMFFLFSLRSNMSRKKQYSMFLGALAIGIAGMTVIGNLRTAHDVFIGFLQIRNEYSDWPMAFLWPVAYISIPFSNLCWVVSHGASHGPTLSFLYPLLPSFMAPSDPFTDVYSGLNMIDNASTYLQAYALNFGYLGIYFVNLLIGLGFGWLVRRAFPRHILILTIFLTATTQVFFSDNFLLLSTGVQVFLQFWVQQKCLLWDKRVCFGANSLDTGR